MTNHPISFQRGAILPNLDPQNNFPISKCYIGFKYIKIETAKRCWNKLEPDQNWKYENWKYEMLICIDNFFHPKPTTNLFLFLLNNCLLMKEELIIEEVNLYDVMIRCIYPL